MKLKKSMEQAVCVLLLLALDSKQAPLKSSWLSKRLNVSDSYLKKILRKLVVEDIVTSDASKDGGFSLTRSLEDISMLDVYYAIEGRESFLNLSDLAERVFNDQKMIERRETELMGVVSEGEQLFLNKLAEYPLARLLDGVVLERR